MMLKKRHKPKKPRTKTIILSMALLMCMSLFIFPMTAYASNENSNIAPPTVEAEVIGSLLRIRANSGFYAVEAVYINERRFNHRVDSALVIDISQYIASGETIAVHAVDFAGNQSNTVLLTPPAPAQPPVPNNLTPEGQGEVLDHLTSADRIEFITIETPAGNVFYLVIDHTRSSNNVYFLNPVTEWDLLTLAAEAELTVPVHIVDLTPQPCEPTVIEREPPPSDTTETTPEPTTTPDEDKDGGRGGLFIFLAIAGAGAFGVIYYLKILKPKKEREMYGGGDEEYDEGDGFEDVDDTDETEDDSGDDEGLEDAYDVDDGRYADDSDTEK